MIELDGRSYTVDDPTTNAYNILSYINSFMVENDVKDKKGNVVQFKISLASPIWLLITGIGYMATVCQKIMYAVAQAFNIASCSDQQLLNLAKVARLSRKQGSYTTVYVTVSAAADGDCSISTSLTAKATYNKEEYLFHPMFNTVISAGTTSQIILICEVTGAVYLNAGDITGFNTVVPNMASFVSSVAQPGSGIESLKSLRTRLMTNEAVSPLQGAIQGINALDGVTKAVIFYNMNYATNIEVAGKVIPPKQAIVFVQGYSTKLAEEYFKHMMSQTFSDETSISMTHKLQNGQNMIFNYFPPKTVTLSVKVKLSKQVTYDRELEIRQAVSLLSNSLTIGSDYTQAYILDSLNPVLNFPEIIGCLISSDNGTTWSESTSFNESNVGLITTDTVSVEAPEDE